MNVKLGKETNVFCVYSDRCDEIITYSEIRINANFEHIPLFIKALSHEYVHLVMNSEIDLTGMQSFMLDNIDSAENGFMISN